MKTEDSVHSAVADSGGVQGHTPGPWMLVKDEFIYTVDGQLVGQAFRQEWSAEPLTEEEATANGRIQAASPDLLKALQAIVALDDGDKPDLWHYQDEFNAARAAINKAVQS